MGSGNWVKYGGKDKGINREFKKKGMNKKNKNKLKNCFKKLIITQKNSKKK